MAPSLDIFRIDPGGRVFWCGAVRNFVAAKARIQMLAVSSPGEYLIVDEDSGNRILVVLPGAPLHKASTDALGWKRSCRGLLLCQSGRTTQVKEWIMSEQTQNFPNREQIERRAYEIYLRRGGVDGSDVADWTMAEEELQATLKESASERTEHPQRAAQVARPK